MGYVDLHVHAGPDVIPRRADDLTLVRTYAAAGFSGCVLKSHYESTVGRAATAAAALAADRSTGADAGVDPGAVADGELRVRGGIALNSSVGGFNPTAVAAALHEGGAVVWLPTQDARTQQLAGLPRLCQQDQRLNQSTYAAPPVDPRTEPALRTIMALIAEADAVLATGHLSAPEVAWVLDAARSAGVRRLLVTHPSYTVPAMRASEAREFAEAGALVEITALQLLHQPGCTAEMLAAFVREVGIEHVVLSSDAGQPDSPSPPDALDHLIDSLADAGLDRSALRTAASDVPAELLF